MKPEHEGRFTQISPHSSNGWTAFSYTNILVKPQTSALFVYRFSPCNYKIPTKKSFESYGKNAQTHFQKTNFDIFLLFYPLYKTHLKAHLLLLLFCNTIVQEGQKYLHSKTNDIAKKQSYNNNNCVHVNQHISLHPSRRQPDAVIDRSTATVNLCG